jgi:hypothetical protein
VSIWQLARQNVFQIGMWCLFLYFFIEIVAHLDRKMTEQDI